MGDPYHLWGFFWGGLITVKEAVCTPSFRKTLLMHLKLTTVPFSFIILEGSGRRGAVSSSGRSSESITAKIPQRLGKGASPPASEGSWWLKCVFFFLSRRSDGLSACQSMKDKHPLTKWRRGSFKTRTSPPAGSAPPPQQRVAWRQAVP